MMSLSPFLTCSASSTPCSAVSPVVGICAGLFETEPLGDAGNLLCRNGNVFGIKAAFAVHPAAGVHLVADLQPVHPRPHGSDRAGPVHAQHQWKLRLPVRIPALADARVPGTDTGRVERNQ